MNREEENNPPPERKSSSNCLVPSAVTENVTGCTHGQFKKKYSKDAKKFRCFNFDYNYLENGSSLKLMSWNVQMWSDVRGKKNFNKVIKLVNYQKPDILFLQEVLSVNIKKFCEKTGMAVQSFNKNLTIKTSNSTTVGENKNNENIIYLTAIFTRPEIRVNCNYSKSFDANFCSDARGYSVTRISIDPKKILPPGARENLPPEGENAPEKIRGPFVLGQNRPRDVNLVNLHLDPFDLSENIRESQINQIIGDVKSQKIPCIIAGDFNSLCKEDYEDHHWNWLCREALARPKKQARKKAKSADPSGDANTKKFLEDIKSRTYEELPDRVIKTLKRNGFVDSSGTSVYPCVYTCWTARKVDYILHSPELDLKNHSVYFTDASDHFPILALFNF